MAAQRGRGVDTPLQYLFVRVKKSDGSLQVPYCCPLARLQQIQGKYYTRSLPRHNYASADGPSESSGVTKLTSSSSTALLTLLLSQSISVLLSGTVC